MMSSTATGTPVLRPVTAADRELLYRIYASTRAEELELTDWDEGQKAAFLRMQFDAQDKYYAENYRGAHFQVIEQGGVPVGRLYTIRWPDEIRIIDIALLPAHRGKGIGTRLLAGIMDEARTSDLAVSIHVERFNPALRFYERLGFRMADDKGVYLLLRWAPVQ